MWPRWRSPSPDAARSPDDRALTSTRCRSTARWSVGGVTLTAAQLDDPHRGAHSSRSLLGCAPRPHAVRQAGDRVSRQPRPRPARRASARSGSSTHRVGDRRRIVGDARADPARPAARRRRTRSRGRSARPPLRPGARRRGRRRHDVVPRRCSPAASPSASSRRSSASTARPTRRHRRRCSSWPCSSPCFCRARRPTPKASVRFSVAPTAAADSRACSAVALVGARTRPPAVRRGVRGSRPSCPLDRRPHRHGRRCTASIMLLALSRCRSRCSPAGPASCRSGRSPSPGSWALGAAALVPALRHGRSRVDPRRPTSLAALVDRRVAHRRRDRRTGAADSTACTSRSSRSRSLSPRSQYCLDRSSRRIDNRSIVPSRAATLFGQSTSPSQAHLLLRACSRRARR